MKTSTVFLLAVCAGLAGFFAGGAKAQDNWLTIRWSDVQEHGRLAPGSSVEHDQELGLSVLKIKGPARGLQLAAFENPPYGKHGWYLRGKVRYADIAEQGHLEMISYFPNGGSFFSRTLSKGKMAPLKGSSGWREFVLPFQSKPGRGPSRVAFNLELPASATVYISDISLFSADIPASVDTLLLETAANAWVSDKTAILLGAWGGAVFGLLGGLIGTLCSLGKGRSFVVLLLRGLHVLGFCLLAFGLIALISGQSWVLCYPPLLLGVLILILGKFTFPQVFRRYEEIELRKIKARDA